MDNLEALKNAIDEGIEYRDKYAALVPVIISMIHELRWGKKTKAEIADRLEQWLQNRG